MIKESFVFKFVRKIKDFLDNMFLEFNFPFPNFILKKLMYSLESSIFFLEIMIPLFRNFENTPKR